MPFLALYILACSTGAGNDSTGDTVDSTPAACADDPRVDTYAANMAREGDAGLYDFTLVASDPGPPVQGTNDWTVLLSDGTGTISDATLTAVPFMPDMGHGTSATPVTTQDGDDYDINPVYLFMSGVWNVTLTAVNGDTTDEAVFTFCVG